MWGYEKSQRYERIGTTCQNATRMGDTMHRGVPRKLSGGNSSLRRARTKERDEITRDAARVT
jgi:hypothetical protein